jgi:hypothetical protein
MLDVMLAAEASGDVAATAFPSSDEATEVTTAAASGADETDSTDSVRSRSSAVGAELLLTERLTVREIERLESAARVFSMNSPSNRVASPRSSRSATALAHVHAQSRRLDATMALPRCCDVTCCKTTSMQTRHIPAQSASPAHTQQTQRLVGPKSRKLTLCEEGQMLGMPCPVQRSKCGDACLHEEWLQLYTNTGSNPTAQCTRECPTTLFCSSVPPLPCEVHLTFGNSGVSMTECTCTANRARQLTSSACRPDSRASRPQRCV